MPKNVQIFLRAAMTLTFVLVMAGAQSAGAQTSVTGEWTASIVSEGSEKLNLRLERRAEKGSKSNMSTTFEFADLRGLSREQVLSGGPVRFSIVREAGTIDCEGSFQNRKGSGTFTFTGNQSFVSGMKARGFDFEKNQERDDVPEDRLFAAAMLNVTTALADDLNSAGFGKLAVGDLFKAAIFKVDSRFMREMKDSGYPNLGMEELVKARIFKIDPAFVTEVVQMGFGKEPFETLVKMRIFKVTPEFIAEARSEGLTNLSVEDLVKMRIFKIDGDFIRQAKAEGVPLEIEKLVEKRIGVRNRQ